MNYCYILSVDLEKLGEDDVGFRPQALVPCALNQQDYGDMPKGVWNFTYGSFIAPHRTEEKASPRSVNLIMYNQRDNSEASDRCLHPIVVGENW